VAGGVTVRLGRPTPTSDADRAVMSALEWEGPRLPTLHRDTIMRRWTGPSWTGPAKTVLVRHRALDGPRWMLSLDRHPPAGFALEYDLGQVHFHAHPGTSRLITDGSGYFTSRIEGALAEGYASLGYVEDAPLPLLDALMMARVRDNGQLLCVSGAEDPLLPHVEIIGSLGYIDGYPMQPRRALDLRGNDWGTVTLTRRVDPESWRHAYSTSAGDVPDGAVSLGALWAGFRTSGSVELRVDGGGRVTSDLLDAQVARKDPRSVVRWIGAPLGWTAGRPKLWAVRATASRARALGTRAATRPIRVEPRPLGYLRRDPAPGCTALYSASHPAVSDQYVTRSELEARDLGYVIDGVLGYIGNASADRHIERLPREVRWGSRFGHRRRYAEASA